MVIKKIKNSLKKRREKKKEAIKQKQAQADDVLGFEEEQPKSLEEEVFKFLKREFSVLGEQERLIPAMGPVVSPTCIIRYGDQSWSVWYRLPVKGETGITYIPDFVIFKGQHRMSPREKNPDLIIECRKLSGGVSNRTDPRIIKEMMGTVLDTLPSRMILVTDRVLSPYARALAKDYGVSLVEFDPAKDPQANLMYYITMEELSARKKLLDALEKTEYKLNNLFRMRKKKEPGAKPNLGSKRGSLKNRIMYALSARPQTPIQLASVLETQENYVLNELSVLEREGMAQVIKRSNRSNGHKHDEWAIATPEQIDEV